MGDFNLSVILDAIRRSPEGLSRVELAGIVGLAAQTVSNICR
ncbi:transcriptional regulator, partial [Vibrio vulnificus]